MLLFTRNFFSFKFTLIILISLNIAFSRGNKNYHVVHFDSLSSKPNCSPHKSGLETHKMKLSHVNGSCPPFANSVEVPSSREILVKDEARVKWLNSRISNSNSHTTMDESEGKSLEPAAPIGNGLEYLTTIRLGTPEVEYKVIIDTGSDPTWVRCTGCQKGCNISISPLFDPSKSSTYVNSNEWFNMRYGDNSSTEGKWSHDKLTLESNDAIIGFRFGCGLNNVDHIDDFAGAAGILGLGRGNDSLVSQSASKFGKIFGYCFPKSTKSAHVFFGDDAKRTASSSTLQFTRLLLKGPPGVSQKPYQLNSLYFLQLVGISVGGNRLNIASDVFTSVGTIIDSGTVLTHLPGKAYEALSSAFNQSMSAYPRAPPPEKGLDSCFTVKNGQNIKIPSVTFHFDGETDVDLDQSGIGLTFEKETWCLAFTAKKEDDPLTIIGSTQQREMVVLYDIDAGKIGFGKKSCGN